MDLSMFARVKSVISRSSGDVDGDEESKPARVGMVVDMSDANYIGGFIPMVIEKQKYPYSRPEFLYFSEEEILLSAEQSVRPVLCAKNPEGMPLYAGYAEVINAGKTKQNEDQSSARFLHLVQQGYDAEEAKNIESKNGVNGSSNGRRLSDDALCVSPTKGNEVVCSSPRAEAALFAIFDGHAGTGAALVASKCLHEHIKSRLSEVLESIIHLDRQEYNRFGKRRSESAYSIQGVTSSHGINEPNISVDSLVIGALEAAFVEMDEQICEEKESWKITGGCAAIAALVVLGKLYVANAGDCRAVLVAGEDVRAMSQDFTPATERQRLQTLAFRQPDLIGNHFSRLEYSRFLTKKDLNTKVLYRDWFMEGWAAKTVRESDLKPPLISDRLRKKRLLNTIGVSRGFGDHHLLTVDEKLHIKPFLSPVPEVRVMDIRRLNSLSDRDVLILGSDGLWDVLSNEDTARIARSALASCEPSDPARYTMAAQELAMAARGDPMENGRWRMASGGMASYDDISVFVIPLKYSLAPPPSEDDDDDEMISLDQ